MVSCIPSFHFLISISEAFCVFLHAMCDVCDGWRKYFDVRELLKVFDHRYDAIIGN